VKTGGFPQRVQKSIELRWAGAVIQCASVTKLHKALLNWYDQHARTLAWRDQPAGSRDAYRVWLSEILLQQTQVSRATSYFEQFVSAFPSVQDLANAPLEAVLKLWEGAGYYARARSLHRAAQIMSERGLPITLEGWLELPGVGRYTAGAIVSLAFNTAAPAVDGNIRRVLARLENNAAPSEDWLWARATTLLDQNRPGAWNEALIELGATVCTPKAPRCTNCPVQEFCAAFKAGTVNRVPAAKPKAKVKMVRAIALLVHSGDCVLLEERPKSGLLGGLHGVPLLEVQTNDQITLEQLLKTHHLEQPTVHVGSIKHTMTHRQFSVEVYAVRNDHPGLERPSQRALSNLDRKILALLEPDLKRDQSSLFSTHDPTNSG
jgi:A/G-specific adenine glycosylase